MSSSLSAEGRRRGSCSETWTTDGCFRYFDDAPENIVWQHLVSDDLIHWTILPMPIRSPQWPNENGTFFVNGAGEVVSFFYGDRGIEPRMAVSRDPDLVNWESFPDRVRFSGVPDEFKTRHDPSAVFKKGDTCHLVCTTVRPQAKAMALPLYKSKGFFSVSVAGICCSEGLRTLLAQPPRHQSCTRLDATRSPRGPDE